MFEVLINVLRQIIIHVAYKRMNNLTRVYSLIVRKPLFSISSTSFVSFSSHLPGASLVAI
jgi:hypothetical protein